MNFSSLCRCCLKELSQDDIESSPWTMDKYIFCIQLQACEEENLPKNFCLTCSGKIQSTYIFIKEARACNQKLQNQISRMEGIKMETDSSHDNTLLNSSLKDLLEYSSSRLREEFPKNENLVLLKTKRCRRKRSTNTINIKTHKDKRKVGSKLEIYEQKLAKKISKTDTSDSSDDDEIQNIDNDSLEEVEFFNVPINKTHMNGLFLELDTVNNKNVKKVNRLPNIKIDEDFEENITKCEISKTVDCKDEIESKNISNLRHRSNTLAHFTCPECSKVWKQYPSFVRHMKTHTADLEDGTTATTQAEVMKLCLAKPHACDKCEKRFRFRALLNRHYEGAHSDKRPFACGSCDKSFKRKSSLRTHMKTHDSKETREKPFECDHCGKKFAEKKGLVAHMYFHSGQRPYSCDQCQKTFQTRQILRKHLGMHEAGYPLMCDVCGKGFRDKYKLAEHMPKHTGERSFACRYCSYRGAYRSVTRRHEKIVHKLTSANKGNQAS